MEIWYLGFETWEKRRTGSGTRWSFDAYPGPRTRISAPSVRRFRVSTPSLGAPSIGVPKHSQRLSLANLFVICLHRFGRGAAATQRSTMPGAPSPPQIFTIEQLVALNPYNPDILPDLESYVEEQVSASYFCIVDKFFGILFSVSSSAGTIFLLRMCERVLKKN